MISTPSDSLGSLSVQALFDQAASTNPAPGGGCISAVCGYFAVSLLLKSFRISLKSHPEDTALGNVEGQLAILAPRFLALAQADSDSFNTYMSALKLPKGNPQEIAARRQAIYEAAVDATTAALNILDTGNQTLDIAHHVQGRVSASILADEKSAVELISAMNSTAEWNADANLGSLTGEVDLAKRLADAKATHVTLLAACRAGQ